MRNICPKWLLAITIALPLLFMLSCSDSDNDPTITGKPVVIFEGGDDGHYAVKVGKEITITPTISNAANPSYQWKIDNKVISTEKDLVFSSNTKGDIYVTFYLKADNGEFYETLLISVVETAAPIVSLSTPEEGFWGVVAGQELKLEPAVKFGEGATYKWELNGKVVSNETIYTFKQDELGEYKLTLTVINEDGEAKAETTIKVLPKPTLSIEFDAETMTIPFGKSLDLKPIILHASDETTYQWMVNNVIQVGSEAVFTFTPAHEQEYTIRIIGKDKDVETTASIIITCTPAEGTYYRKANESSLSTQSKVFEYLPAPGQLINEEQKINTLEEASAYALKRMQDGAYVSLGGFGGYVVVGFDHSIDNVADKKYHFAIGGNSFAGSSEPGIVWVMQDENGNGLPDDTWYELKGSEYGKPETTSNYAVTYFKPSAPGMDVQWKDNRGNTGLIDYLGAYHSQDYYYPQWITSSSYTLKGTCLKARNIQNTQNGLWTNLAYDWGYADNFGQDKESDSNTEAGVNANYFSINNAVTRDGKNANLKYIDFVKVQTGVNAKSGWIGEISTEVFGFTDINLK